MLRLLRATVTAAGRSGILAAVLGLSGAGCASLGGTPSVQKPASVLFYGRDYSFFVDTPKGWVLDVESARASGLQAILYPEGATYESAPALIYANAIVRADGGKEPVEAAIDRELRVWATRLPEVPIVYAAPLPTADGKTATVKHFLGGKGDAAFEAVAYVGEEKTVSVLVLSARNQDGFEIGLPIFARLVGSYTTFKEGVPIPPSQ